MYIFIKVLVFLVVVLQNVDLGFTIRCYQCEEQMDKNLACEMSTRSVLTENCTESFVCLKYIWKDNDIKTLHRHCGPASKCETLKAEQTESHFLQYCSTCTDELCNAAPIPNYSSFLITSIVLCIIKLTI